MKINIINDHYGCNRNSKIAFNSKLSKARAWGCAFSAAALMSLSACINSNNKNADTYEKENVSVIDKNISNVLSENKKTENNKAYRSYHYFPTDDNITAENFSWSEIVYPDGRIEKDSLGHKIYISADGKRTIIKTEKNEQGFVTITKIFPDNSKRVYSNYSQDGDSLYVEKEYWPNGNLKENKYFNEYVKNYVNDSIIKIKEEEYELYNENEVLIYWESTISDPERSSKYNKYDKQRRIIYDDIKQEKYQYKGNSKIPFQSYSEHDGCKRITLYNPDGSVKNIYFKAKDGTITNKNP